MSPFFYGLGKVFLPDGIGPVGYNLPFPELPHFSDVVELKSLDLSQGVTPRVFVATQRTIRCIIHPSYPKSNHFLISGLPETYSVVLRI